MSEKEKEEEQEQEEEQEIRVSAVINKEQTKVLFAEVDSAFIDIMLSFLLLPLGTIVRVLKRHYRDKMPVIGSLTALYNGVANLDDIHFMNHEDSTDTKTFLLNPTSLDQDENPDFHDVFIQDEASFVISDDLKVMLSVEGSVISTLTNLGVAMRDTDGTVTLDMDFTSNMIMTLLRVIITSRNPVTALFGGSRTKAAPHGNGINRIPKKAILVNSKKMTLKVMMHKSTNKLLFAQARDDFVSFLFGMLTLPLGRVEWYLHSNTGLIATDNLHRSIRATLYSNGLISPETKDLLFKPRALLNDDKESCDLSDDKESSDLNENKESSDLNENKKSSDVKDDKESCDLNDYFPLNFDPNMNQDRVRGSRMYMVKDDLSVSLLSISSSLSLLKQMNISSSDVHELELQVGLEEGLRILKAALVSTTALTDSLITPMLKKKDKAK